MLPLPSRTHPQKQNLVVYTEELTHLRLTGSVQFVNLRLQHICLRRFCLRRFF